MNSINPASWPQNKKEQIYKEVGNPMQTKTMLSTIEQAIQIFDMSTVGKPVPQSEVREVLADLRAIRKELTRVINEEKQIKYQEERKAHYTDIELKKV